MSSSARWARTPRFCGKRSNGCCSIWMKARGHGSRGGRAVCRPGPPNGVRTRKVAPRVQALGLEGTSKRTVSRVAQELDARITAFRERPLEGRIPTGGWAPGLGKVRDGDRVFSTALVVGVRETGEPEGLGFDGGWSEAAAFWTGFFRRLRARGAPGHQRRLPGPPEATQTVFPGASCGSGAACISCGIC
ncbi:protein of unknown function [Candidatus Hydrogenisulfobacillus filiaventi]|uniref:Mutator family transposase n=1 Tax=Candidatus Hydrogenisulfobacillus filiaventi TaxID=2707344 RepID=A0A6F8ZDL3_9FIRM|nr:protein of unknown function [Candidatus Hydrogenisulfobacillus filiaventi]